VLALLSLLLARSATGAPPVPAPDQVLGFRPGADHKLADYATLVRYFRALDAASDRVRVVDVGPTAEGRTMIAAIITSEANHRRLERLKQVSRELARARDLDDGRARALAAEGRAIVWIDSGLHATEVAPAQHAPELAFRVATEESAEMRRIRENVVLVLLPVMNPDGLDRVVGWYRRNLGTPYEVAPMVELYHRYAGHDNNRDWYMFQMPESRHVARLLYEEWLPQIVYNHHQTAPFPARIFVPPFAEPMNPNIPPQVMRGINTVGDAITARLEREGKTGAVSRLGFDTWWNGGMRTAPYFHNMVGILTETALWRYATPYQYDPAKLPKRFRDGTAADTPSTFYPSPWKGGWWRLRDAVDYMLTASLATLDVAAQKRAEWLYGMYQMGRDAIAAGRRGKPFAYVLAADQRDPGAAARLVDALRTGGVEVRRVSSGFEAGGRRFEAGAVVVPMAQAFRAHAKDLLEVQRYPERREGPSGAPQQPYDITGWTLPAQMGVEGIWVEDPFEATLEPVTDGAAAFPGSLTGSGRVLLVDARANGAFVLANRALAGGGTVRRATASFKAGGRALGPGAFIIEGGLDLSTAQALARTHGVAAVAADTAPEVAAMALRTARIGLYKPWVANMDEGWTRWLLEQHEFPYRNLADEDVRRGGLRAAFDIIVLPDAPVRSLLDGHLPGSVPPEYAGGLGLEGALALKDFVQEGGTLVTLDSSSDLALDLFGLGVRNILRTVPRQEYYAPGGLLRVMFDPAQPLAWGMPTDAFAFVENGPAFAEAALTDEEGEETPALAPTGRPAPRFVGRFAEKDVLYSGWLLGESKIAGKGAVVEAPLGRGRVILIGFRPQFRAQPYGTFKVLFNALLQPRD
jgi:zinc carboxypeptidase